VAVGESVAVDGEEGTSVGVPYGALCCVGGMESPFAATDKPARQMTARPIDAPARLNRLMFRHAPIPLVAATAMAVQATKTNTFSVRVDAGRKVSPAVSRAPKIPVDMPIATPTRSVSRVTSSPSPADDDLGESVDWWEE
jgi:hypothetical protein